MSLKISDTTRLVFRIIGIVLLVALIACIIRVIVWEHFYYQEKEGSPRTTISTPFTEIIQQADETEITEEVRKEYIVAPDKPRYLSIDKIGIHNARVLEVSAESGKPMGTPAGIYDIGWARTSSKPGQGGTILMDGHNGGPTKDGVFKRLGQLGHGDIISIERGDGQIFYYELQDTITLTLAEANLYMATIQQSPIPGRESLSLITCTGEWNNANLTFDSRIMLRATRIEA